MLHCRINHVPLQKSVRNFHLVCFVVLVVIDKKPVCATFLLAVLEGAIDLECQGIAINLLVLEFFQLADLNKNDLRLAIWEQRSTHILLDCPNKLGQLTGGRLISILADPVVLDLDFII